MIGEGSYYTVHEGFYKSKPVAVKIIHTSNPSAVIREHKEKFQREVLLLSRMDHENVAKFIDALVEPTMMIVTELMKGGTLQRYLWSMRPHLLELKHSLFLALDISRAMEYLHANVIIHRNLLLTNNKCMSSWLTSRASKEVMGGRPCKAVLTCGWLPSYTAEIRSPSDELLTNKAPFKGRDNVLVAYAAAKNERPSLEGLPTEIASLLQSCWPLGSRPEDSTGI